MSVSVLLPIAVALFIAAAISWRVLGLSVTEIDWRLIAVSALLVPASVVLTAAEYRLIARANDITVGWIDSVVIAVVGAAANLLPIPGALAVRMNDLVARNAKTASAARATVGIGILWLGWALTVSGLALATAGSLIVGLTMLVGGVVAIVMSWIVAPRRSESGPGAVKWIVQGSTIELLSLATGTLRIWLTLMAIGTAATLVQSIGLVAAGAISSTVGIIPGGLGLRELIAGVLAPIMGLEVAAAIVAVTIVRIVGIAVQAPLAVILARGRANRD